MKKSLRFILVILIIFTIIFPLTYSYAIDKQNENIKEKLFFEISKLEVTKNEKIEMVLNLDVIKYDNFIFELQASEDIENVEISQNNNVETEKNNNEIVMEINKEKTNVNTINLYYSIPQNKKVGDKIKFVATITSIINNEINEQIENQNIVDVQNNKENENDININNLEKEQSSQINENITQEKQEIEYEVKIIEEKEEQISNNDDNKNNNQNTENIKQEIPNNQSTENVKQEIPNNQSTENVKQEIPNNQNTENVKQEIPNNQNTENVKQEIPNNQNTENVKQEIPNNQNTEKNNIASSTQKILAQNIPTSTQYLTMNSSSQTVQDTYKGSDNNYLSGLSIKEYELNKEFSKDNTTYFITVENEIEKLDIETIADDSNATIVVYGNENLKEGTNKILISVTAENGNVRNYRIYVTRKA